MAPAGDSLAGELSVPEVGTRDGVGVCATSVIMLSNGGVATGWWPGVVGEEKMEEVDEERLVVL